MSHNEMLNVIDVNYNAHRKNQVIRLKNLILFLMFLYGGIILMLWLIIGDKI